MLHIRTLFLFVNEMLNSFLIFFRTKSDISYILSGICYESNIILIYTKTI